MQEHFIRIDGMTCNHCVKNVTELLSALPGITEVNVTLEPGGATLRSSEPLNKDLIRNTLDDAGFDLVEA